MNKNIHNKIEQKTEVERREGGIGYHFEWNSDVISR